MEKKEVKKSKNSKIGWVVGSAALTVAGFMVIPPLLKKYGNKIYKASNKAEKIDFENLGPEIVKKEEEFQNKEEQQNDN